MKQIELPNGEMLEFPDETPDEVIAAVSEQHMAQGGGADPVAEIAGAVRELAMAVAHSNARLDTIVAESTSRVDMLIANTDSRLNAILGHLAQNPPGMEQMHVLAAQVQDLSRQMAQDRDDLIAAITAPKQIIRDKAGNMTRVEIARH